MFHGTDAQLVNALSHIANRKSSSKTDKAVAAAAAEKIADTIEPCKIDKEDSDGA